MDFYRVVVVKEGIRRVADFEASRLPIVVQESQQAGWKVSYILLDKSADLLDGIIEESTNLLMN